MLWKQTHQQQTLRLCPQSLFRELVSSNLRIIPSDARSGHRSISSIVFSTDCGILMPYLASHLSRLDISEWSTFSANRSIFDRGRSKAADDEGQSSANGNDWKSSARLCRKFWATGSSWDGFSWLLVFTYWEVVGSVVNDVLGWQRQSLIKKNNNNRAESIAARLNCCANIRFTHEGHNNIVFARDILSKLL